MSGNLPPPTPELMLFLADVGPDESTAKAVRKCRERVDRIERNLGSPALAVVRFRRLDLPTMEALDALAERCRLCGLCADRVTPAPPQQQQRTR